jgi:hypothetical protein
MSSTQMLQVISYTQLHAFASAILAGMMLIDCKMRLYSRYTTDITATVGPKQNLRNVAYWHIFIRVKHSVR